ncbi:MAG: alpha amylase C-terminal domain-containing protein [Deltaproteobacteria bacterium]|nr:alpha amylase C-terminal domain-containing protein [Deltaproteobacteria bacterium]
MSDRSLPLIEKDPYLKPFERDLTRRIQLILDTEARLTRHAGDLRRFASGHEYFGLHQTGDEWVFREWAPNATALFLIGDMTGWREFSEFALNRIDDHGVWEIRLPGDALRHGDLFKLRIYWPGGGGDRIPAWSRRVVQDPESLIFNAQVWAPPELYQWTCEVFSDVPRYPLIYEAHVGMAQEAEQIGTYQAFAERVIPRIVKAGYTTLQLMALQEHPYYGSFGYHVSSFFAASSRFGTPEELKKLIDTAHENGLAVIMDLVHSHAVSNEVEGLARFDGTQYQFFHAGPRGRHEAWDSLCFDYGKDAVLHFLLSNCRFWLDEYRVDGFRFDGITSMLYHHHGLGQAFTGYGDYFGSDVDEDALCYLTLANRLIHDIRPGAITLAEDVSGMPGLAAPFTDGGIGFDFRFAMGVPDYWIRLTKDIPDEDWPMGQLWYELTNRRADEKTISYAESHDQALVGDQTLIFRLIGADMYHHMGRENTHLRVERGVALHKMIRLITLTTAQSGYLNFMGNEFGHPEWIDFPREGNNWSYRYARRQWHLMDDPSLKYRWLALFDRDMIDRVKRFRILEDADIRLRHEHSDHKIMAFERAGLVFIFNFHPRASYTDYRISASPGDYRMVLDSDNARYGGHGRLVTDQTHTTITDAHEKGGRQWLSLYLPTRTAIVLAPNS